MMQQIPPEYIDAQRHAPTLLSWLRDESNKKYAASLNRIVPREALILPYDTDSPQPRSRISHRCQILIECRSPPLAIAIPKFAFHHSG